MRRIKRWKNVSGALWIECEMMIDGKVVDLTYNMELPEIVCKELCEVAAPVNLIEIRIPFLSSGYYDEGKVWGPPENCYPPEGDDERIPDGNSCVKIDNTKRHRLSGEASKALFDMYEEKIMEVEITLDED